ncbi:TolB family protein [Nocardioides alcanivorans]|uniref:TolB family protein n=1 Tax=Nocardioides alcanivorans TaxID=2897352 RepID=UPI001F45A7BA|nr:hypothetical protein [Nocardioides alcanivorans]
MLTVTPAPWRHRIAATTATAVVGATLVTAPFGAAQAANPPITVQVSVTTGGFGPDHGSNGDTGTTRVLSKDGRYVVFASSGPVVPGQKQLSWQIVRRDRQLGTTELISKSSNGAMGNGHSHEPSVSADGQVIAFRSSSSNLVPGDTNGTTDIFVHDVRTGTTTRASVTSSGAQVPTGQVAGDNVVGPPSISADGRWVGFTSRVQGYTPDDGTASNAYLHDRQTGAIEVVSRHANGVVGSAHVSTPVVPSANGDFVTFQSLDNLSGGSNNAAIDIFVRDRRAGQATTTAVGGKEWRDLRQSMTPDGRFVVYDTGDADQVAGDTNGRIDVFVHDRVTQTYERVSVASNGTQGNGNSSHGSISDDGRYVSFLSVATNLAPGDTNNVGDVFRHDRQTGQTIRVNVDTDGAQATASTYAPAISGNGQHVSFNSYSRLTPVATKTWQQVFVRDLASKYPALFARLGRTPNRVVAKETYRIPSVDIRTGPALRITWSPVSGKGKAVQQTAAVQNNGFTLRAPERNGKFTVTFSYADQLLGTRTIAIPKPGAKKLAKAVKKNKRLKVATVGVKAGQKVQVRWTPRGMTGGKVVKRAGKVNKSGILKVRPATRRGPYQVVVRSNGKTLRKGIVRVR